jgi:hypothetical protein
MTSSRGPNEFPLAPLVVTAGGLVTELGVVTAAAGILTRLGDQPAPDIGVPVFVLFVIGAAITLTGVSAFVMRWGTVHRVLAVALGLAMGAIALIARGPHPDRPGLDPGAGGRGPGDLRRAVRTGRAGGVLGRAQARMKRGVARCATRGVTRRFDRHPIR